MKKFALAIFLLVSTASFAQLAPNSKVYLQFIETPNEVNVHDPYALLVLESYIKNKTTLLLAPSSETSDYTINLQVYEKKWGNRMGKIKFVDSKTKNLVFESKWKKGFLMASPYYCGTRHAIGRIFHNEPLLKVYSNTY